MHIFQRVLILSFFSLILFFALLYAYYLKSGRYHIAELCFAQDCFKIYSTPSSKPVLIKPPPSLPENLFASRARTKSELNAQLIAMCQQERECQEEINSARFYQIAYLKEFVLWCNQDKQCRETYAQNPDLPVRPNRFLSWKINQTWLEQQKSIKLWVFYIIGRINKQNNPGMWQGSRELSSFSNRQHASSLAIQAGTIGYIRIKIHNNSPVFCGKTKQSIITKPSILHKWWSLLAEQNQQFIFIAATEQLFLGKPLNNLQRIYTTENPTFQEQWYQNCDQGKTGSMI